MAEINVTALVTEGEMFEFSASRAERGQNAGPETWANAKAEAAVSTPAATKSSTISGTDA